MTNRATSRPLHHLSPQAIVMDMVTGAWVAQTLSAVTRLDIPDFLQQDGPLTVHQLIEAHDIQAHPESLERILRACASIGIFTEDADGRFGPTPLSEALTRTAPASVKSFVELYGGSWWQFWAGLPDTLQTGQPQVEAQLGMDYWTYCQTNPQEMATFGEAMRSRQEAIQGLLAYYDFTDAQTIIDVGGGFGHVAIALLQQYVHLHATVVDLPDLILLAKQHVANENQDLLSRLSFVGQDMFVTVPPGDVYILSGIIHDWDDRRCQQLLQNCVNQMPSNGRILCIDAILPPMGNTTGSATKLLDINMMLSGPGKERTEAQWHTLYNQVGLEISSITPIKDSDLNTCIIEGNKRQDDLLYMMM